jgi:hypothetical protein
MVDRFRPDVLGLSGFDLAAALPAGRAPAGPGWIELDVCDPNAAATVVDRIGANSGGVEILADWAAIARRSGTKGGDARPTGARWDVNVVGTACLSTHCQPLLSAGVPAIDIGRHIAAVGRGLEPPPIRPGLQSNDSPAASRSICGGTECVLLAPLRTSSGCRSEPLAERRDRGAQTAGRARPLWTLGEIGPASSGSVRRRGVVHDSRRLATTREVTSDGRSDRISRGGTTNQAQ